MAASVAAPVAATAESVGPPFGARAERACSLRVFLLIGYRETGACTLTAATADPQGASTATAHAAIGEMWNGTSSWGYGQTILRAPLRVPVPVTAIELALELHILSASASVMIPPVPTGTPSLLEPDGAHGSAGATIRIRATPWCDAACPVGEASEQVVSAVGVGASEWIVDRTGTITLRLEDGGRPFGPGVYDIEIFQVAGASVAPGNIVTGASGNALATLRTQVLSLRATTDPA